MRTKLLLMLARAALFMLAATIHADEPRAPFTLSVVPSRSSGEERGISTAQKQTRVFHVLLTNVSDRPQPVWEAWNSWGYQAVSFEFILPDGKRLAVSKKPQEFTVNFPSVFIIPPGEQQVFPIQLNDQWDNRPDFGAPGATPVTLKAIYSVEPTPESVQRGVWTERVESTGYHLMLRH